MAADPGKLLGAVVAYCSNLYNLICVLAPTLSDIVGFAVAPKADQSRFQPLDFGFWGF